jgi:hypothetical protein
MNNELYNMCCEKKAAALVLLLKVARISKQSIKLIDYLLLDLLPDIGPISNPDIGCYVQPISSQFRAPPLLRRSRRRPNQRLLSDRAQGRRLLPSPPLITFREPARKFGGAIVEGDDIPSSGDCSPDPISLCWQSTRFGGAVRFAVPS